MDRFVSFLIEAVGYYLNLGIEGGLILGIIWLLRPITNRLLSPRQRYWLWALGWNGATFHFVFKMLDWINVFPVTLRDFLVPGGHDRDVYHLYLPEYEGEGLYELAFPGGGTVSVALNDAIMLVLTCIFLVGSLAVGVKLTRGSKKLLKLGRQGELLDRPDCCTWLDDPVDVYLCDNIPTSFVHQGRRPTIFLQKDLPEHRRELVLKHELNHINMRHCQLKAYMVLALQFHWWNPLIWLAYFATCLDLELDCDERTIKDLTPEERREYAHTLVELGAGRQLWDAPLCFGECDTAVRVKAVAAWKPMDRWHKLGTGLLTILLMLCFTGGPLDSPGVSMWRELTQEDPAQMARLLSSNRDIPQDDIVEIWLAEHYNSEDSFCLMADGSWWSVSISHGVFGVGTSGWKVVEEPELSAHRRIY